MRDKSLRGLIWHAGMQAQVDARAHTAAVLVRRNLQHEELWRLPELRFHQLVHLRAHRRPLFATRTGRLIRGQRARQHIAGLT